jgi:phosphoribosyl 1,2-cyclic phosphodiesterase
MSLFITSLNSGSNGNCYYIGNDTEAVLIDAGISCRETEKRMRMLGLSMKKVKAVFVSHEHSDHIKGIPVISNKYQLPVFVTSTTLRHCGTAFVKQYVNELVGYRPVQIGGLTVTAFPKHHDAEDPHSFIISCNGLNIGVFTDIGASCDHVIAHFSKCHAAFLEANYDEALLENGHYPIFLKNRIRGGKGHLSNKQALEIFTKHRPPFMSHLFLSHLSRDNNSPGIVQQLFEAQAGRTKIIVASRYEQTDLYTIREQEQSPLVKSKTTGSLRLMMQLNLFE